MLGITTAVVLDKRIEKKNGTYAIKLRVTYSRQQQYYPIGKHLSATQWTILHEENPKDAELKRLKLLFAEIEKKATKLIDEMEVFSFQEFEKKFNHQPKSSSDVLEAINTKKDLLKAEDRLNSFESYKSTHKSITGFLSSKNRKKLKYSDITSEWLTEYEAWMTSSGKSITTTGIYLRNLRTIFNQAIDDGIVQREFYPFGKRRYQVPASINVKKALTIEEIKLIVKYKPLNEAEERARDLWLFSYLCNGVNIKDISKLQFRNLTKKHISFVRSKTERSTKSSQEKIIVIRIPEIDRIINKWGSKLQDPDQYVFNIISEGDSSATQLAKIKQATKTINKYIKRIGTALKIEHNLSNQTARHSFSTVLKRSGAPIEFISESLGHKDLKTTENYLDSFEDDAKEAFQKKLLDFKTD